MAVNYQLFLTDMQTTLIVRLPPGTSSARYVQSYISKVHTMYKHCNALAYFYFKKYTKEAQLAIFHFHV